MNIWRYSNAGLYALLVESFVSKSPEMIFHHGPNEKDKKAEKPVQQLVTAHVTYLLS
jgi:hypothetical protein